MSDTPHTSNLIADANPKFIARVGKKLDAFAHACALKAIFGKASTLAITGEVLMQQTLIGMHTFYQDDAHIAGAFDTLDLIQSEINIAYPRELYSRAYQNFHHNAAQVTTPIFGNKDQTCVKRLGYFLASENARDVTHAARTKTAKQTFLAQNPTMPAYHPFFKMVAAEYDAAKYAALMAHYEAGDEDRRNARETMTRWAGYHI